MSAQVAAPQYTQADNLPEADRRLSGLCWCLRDEGNFRDRWRWSVDEDSVFTVKELSRMIEKKILCANNGGQEMIWNKLVPKKLNICMWRALKGRFLVRVELDERGIDLDSVLPCLIAFLSAVDVNWLQYSITSLKCVLTQEHLDAICAKYFVPEEVHPQLPSSDATMHERPAGKVGMYTRFFDYANYRIPFSTFFVSVLTHFRIPNTS
ncbi:RNA-directed DNA polymerase, eukaryota, reverse transcriptase zinc-binding domain protein [Tanacetum coccineum]